MDEYRTVPFVSVVAGLLLCNSRVTAVEVINFISKLSSSGIEVDDGEDASQLAVCVDVDNSFNFSIKKDYYYDTLLEDGRSVFKFLNDMAGSDMLPYISNDNRYINNYQLYGINNDAVSVESSTKVKAKKKVSFLSAMSFISGFHF